MTPEPVMSLTWNLDQWLNLTKEPRQNQKKIDDDVVTTKYDVINTFSDLWLIWSNPEPGFPTNGLWFLHFYLKQPFILQKCENKTKKPLS